MAKTDGNEKSWKCIHFEDFFDELKHQSHYVCLIGFLLFLINIKSLRQSQPMSKFSPFRPANSPDLEVYLRILKLLDDFYLLLEEKEQSVLFS